MGDPAISPLTAERPDMFLHKPFEVGEYLERVSALLALDRSPE